MQNHIRQLDIPAEGG